MQLSALARSATGMTDRQCEASNELCGLRGGGELTTTWMTKQVNTGRSCTGDWKGEVPARAEFCHGGLSGAGEHVTQTTANVWCWPKEAATESWRRDLNLQVSSLVLDAVDRMTISTHGAFSTGRVRVGRGR